MNSRKKKSAPEGPVYVPTIDNTRNALHSSRKPYDSGINAVEGPAHVPIIDNNYDTYPSKESYDNGMHASAPVKTSSSTTNRGVAPGANMQKVFISHVESPSDFWIQYPGDRRELESYDNEIGSRNGASLTVAALNKCSINNTLLFTLQENCLRRVKVMSLDTSSSVKVHFVDYGYKRCVELSSLRTIENHRILNRMPLCQNCRLYDCYPYGEPDWNEKIIERFKELVEKQELNMHVFAVRESKLEVDLSAKSFSSARDYLVSLDQAQYLPPDRKIYGIKKSSEILHYQTNMHRYEPNTRISADVMHLDSPGEFYLSEVDETWDRELDQLNSELDSYFRLSYHYKNAYLHNLAIGMAIAAQYCDNKWYRAEVCEVSDSSPRHKVKYVDFGTYETLNLTRMRAIPEQYVHLPVRAVRSSLHDIVPLKKTWQPDALQSFVALVNNVRLDVLIHNITGDELKVSLFKKNHKSIKEEKNPLLCINEVLVQEGKARGIGIYNKVLPVAKKEAPVAKKEAPVAKKEAPGAKKEAPVAKKEAPVAKKEAPVAKKEAPVAKKEVPVEKKEAPVAKKEEPVDAASGSVTDEEKDLSPQKKPEAVENMERSSSIEKPELEGDVMQSSSLLQSDLSATDVNVNDKKDSLKVPIEIVRCSDPHLIHVRTDQQRVSLADLLGRMKEHYNAKKMSADTSRLKISNEMRCAVLIREDDRWYRAKVLKKLSDYTFHVYLNDCGRNEEVSLPNIRPLEDEFTNVPDGCTRCSLYGFSNEHTWPSKLCEKLKELTQTFEHYYMTVKGRQGKTVEILLWAKVIQCDGPLDPTRTEWINIGSKLQTSEDQEDISLVPPLESNLKQVDSDCSSKDTDRKVKKWLNEMTVAKKKDLSENGSDPKFASSHDTVDDGDSVSTELEDSDVEDSASATEDHDVERSQWMPPVPLKKKKFIGIPKFVTETMEIRVQLLKDQKAVEKLQAKLQEHYGMKDVYDPSDTWTYGRICVSRFRFDDNWYRAQVINISQNEREVFVEYVDYGSVDWMSMSKVRSDVICTRKPLLCHKLSVLPAYEKVSEDVVVYIQKLFADKHCTIELSEVGPDNVCRIKSLSYTDAETDEFISLYEELDRLMIGPLSPLSDELETKIVSSDDSTSETDTSISSIQDMSEAPFYNPDQIRLKYLENFSISCAKQETDDETLQILEVQPPTSEIVTVKVTEILRENLIAVHIIDCQSNPKIAKVAKKFIKLETHLNKDGIKQPIIKPPFVGRVCCTQFEDNMWYRAFVVEKDDCADRYAVYYMDYGNTTYVVASKLHQLKPEWYKVPAQAVKCNTILSGAPLPELSEFILNHNYRAIIHKTDFKKKRNEPNELKYSIQLLDCEYCKFSA